MKHYALLVFIPLLSLIAPSTSYSQNAEDIWLIYIDNSNPSSDDILRSSQLKALEDLSNKLGVNDDKEFVMFLSDGEESRIISSRLSIERFLSSLEGKHTERPDPFNDVLRMRGSVYEKLNGSKGGTVQFHLFVTGPFMQNLNSRINPLIELFPKEMEDLFSVTVKIKIHAPKTGNIELGSGSNNSSGNVKYDVVYYD